MLARANTHQTHLIYLHGFRSSPRSAKANLLRQYLIDVDAEIVFYSPFLNQSPDHAIAEVKAYIEKYAHHNLVLVGSSLGGFYATWLAEQYRLPAIVINPAITPWQDLKAYLGKQPLYHGGGEIEIKYEYFDQLLKLAVQSITLPHRYLLLASTHDEVINYQDMLVHYPNTNQISIERGDHGVSNFADYLETTVQFCKDQACSAQQKIDNTFGLICWAERVFRIKTEQELFDLFKYQKMQTDLCTSYVVLGSCSNVILPDQLTQTTILMEIKGRQLIEETADNVLIELAAGELWHDVVVWTIAQNWVGIENLALIPGTAGAAPIQNIGAYGVELANVVESVKIFDPKAQTFFWIDRDACEFSYRHSVFKNQPHWIVVAIRLCLAKYSKQAYQPFLTYQDFKHYFADVSIQEITPKRVMDAVIEIRQRKLPEPLKIPNVGSFFKNPIVSHEIFLTIRDRLPERSYHVLEHQNAEGADYKLFAARLIEAAGLKGEILRGAGVSAQHALVLINRGQATRTDVNQLVSLIQSRVMDQFGVLLSPEPVFIDSII